MKTILIKYFDKLFENSVVKLNFLLYFILKFSEFHLEHYYYPNSLTFLWINKDSCLLRIFNNSIEFIFPIQLLFYNYQFY